MFSSLSVSSSSAAATLTNHFNRLHQMPQSRFSGNNSFSNQFIQEFEEHWQSPSQFISAVCIPVNLLGTGVNANAYSLPNMPTYVLKVNKNAVPANIKAFTPNDINFGDKNLGQPIGSLGEGYDVLLKQEGKEHSISNWSQVLMQREEMTQSDAQSFLRQLENIAALPQTAYNKQADDILFLHTQGYKIDPFNPSNFLITASAINTIDYFKIPEHEKQIFNCTVYDMVYGLLDVALFPTFHSLLSGDEQNKLVAAAKQTVQKCYQAASDKGLSTSFDVFGVYLDHTDKWFGNKLPDKNYRARLEATEAILKMGLTDKIFS